MTNIRNQINPKRSRSVLAVASCAFALSASFVLAESGVTEDQILIGSFLPLQSGLSAGATQMMEGTDAYFQHINEQGGVNGRQIEWIVENDSYNPQQTVAVTKKLVDRDDVFAIVSTLGTVTNLAVLPFLNQRGVPIINPAGGHEQLNKPTDKNVFGILPLSSEIGASMAEHAIEKMGAERIAIFYQNDQFGKDQRDGVVAYLEQQGMEPVAEATYVPSDVDVSAQVVALRDSDPDAVVLGVIPKHGSLFMLEAEKLGWDIDAVGHNTMADPVVLELAGDALEGVHVNLMTAVDTMDRPAVKMANEILGKYYPDTKPGYYPYLGMAGAMIFVEAVERAGEDLTRESLIAALETMNPYEPGIVPPIQWSEDYHGGPRTFGYAMWEGGKLTVLEDW